MSFENGLLEISNAGLEPTANYDNFNEIPVIDKNLKYTEFFESFFIPNLPCLIDNVTETWPCTQKWIKNKTLNVEYFRNNLENTEVPISNCGKREYNVQQKCSMKLFEYLDYWEKYKAKQETKCLYLKDWHFVKEYPKEEVYRVPGYFASDWLNEYYDSNPQLNDDYRFVYIGPKGSWTPFHSDVFTSYSWSVNISGRKKWVLIPPGVENNFKDALGNLNYEIELPECKSNLQFKAFEIIQEEGQGLFVPSGWHHQVWNLEDTISINHNWINGCNIHYVWESLQKNLSAVMNEISDCKDMENWESQCQLVLAASFGINYRFFHSFLVETAKTRLKALKTGANVSVFGGWSFGENHIKFDLRQIYSILKELEKDENYLEVTDPGYDFTCSKEIYTNLDSFL